MWALPRPSSNATWGPSSKRWAPFASFEYNMAYLGETMNMMLGRTCVPNRVYLKTTLCISQSVSHYHTPSRELMDHTHSDTLLFFYFEYGDYLCNVVFSLLSCLPPGPALEDDVLFPFAFHLCFLSLILMRTDLGVEPSTCWKCQIRPSRAQKYY